MRPEDIELLSSPASPTAHGELVVVSVSSPDPRANDYRGGLLRVPLDGGRPMPLTWGSHDTHPVLSPDGSLLAFTRPVADPGGTPHAQLHVLPTGGGEPRCLTSLPLGVGEPVWSPDGARIAFTARIPEPGRYGSVDPEWDDAPKPEHEAVRRITRFDYGLDDVGYVGDRHHRLFVLAVPPAGTDPIDPAELTDGRCDVRDPVWLADGQQLVVVAPHSLGERETHADDLYAIPATGGDPVLVAEAVGSIAATAVTGDDVVLFVATDQRADAVAHNHGLFAVPVTSDRPGTPRRLTDVETVDIEPSAGSPVPVDGAVLVAVRNRGAIELRRIPLDADGVTLDELPVLLGERAAVRAFTATPDRTVAVVSTPDSPGEVVVRDTGELRTLTDFAAPVRAAGIRPVTEINGTAPDGYPVHGWVVLPEGSGPHPVLLCVHGGPFMYHGWGFFDEAQIYASAGYAVVLPNPRGSAGYGESHGRSIVRALATVDVTDILATLDAALELPELDGGQVGVMGGSYGGYMTGWLASHHGERFRAAWSERAVNSWDSFSGSSDIGWFFTDDYVGPDLAEQRRLSPLTYADRIRIPFAVAHSEHDLRCPFEQGQRMFVALKKAGVPTEMLVFPGEGHELTRSGRPRHRVQRFRAALDWWSRHLKVSDPGWRVRPARPADGPRIAQIRVLSWQYAYRHLLPSPALAAMRPEAGAARWTEYAGAESPARLFVAVDSDDVPIAYCMAGDAREERDRHPSLPTGELWAIYADPAVMGTGAGSALHEAAMDHLVRLGFRHAVLWVLDGNERAIRFYRAHGWTPDGGQSGFEYGGAHVTEARYVREL